MPQYTGSQSVLNAALGEFHSKGFSLIEQGDDIVILFYRNERVAEFSQTGMTIPTLRRTCQAYLEKVKCPFNPDARCSMDKKFTCIEIDCPVYRETLRRGEKSMSEIKWAKTICPECGEEYQYLEGGYKPATCGKFECVQNYNIRNRRI